MDPSAQNSVEHNGHFVWEVPDKDTVVRLSYDVVDRLLLEVMRGFGSTPRRGAEVGGVLLGSIEAAATKVVTIDDYDPVPCSHSFGPSFQLSEQEAGTFAAKIERAQSRAVGFYRSHTRDALSMLDDDARIYDQHFAASGGVVLLIKPYATRVSVGAFFIAEEGRIRRTESSYREFPFRRRELGGGLAPLPASAEPARVETQSSQPGAAGAGREAVQEPLVFSDPIKKEPEIATVIAPSPSGGGVRSGWVWIPLSFIFLLLGVLLGFQAAITMGSRMSHIKPEAVGLSLAVERQGDSLHLRWDPNAPAIRGGKRAVLVITDGASSRTLKIEPDQLRAGSVIYRRVSEPVSFKMEVFVKETLSVTETVEFHLSQPAK